MEEIILTECVGFEWDISNQDKNWTKHSVTKWECEQTFFNSPLLLYADTEHSQKENRMYVLGQTDEGRELFIAFTIRNKLIRVISARTMSRNERGIYAKA
ncbi:MAG TPA: BrnT family toxin [Gammaproteobacteria bacterium]|nr:BrnT family toxin [Gammaproteobacteria bacterium]